MWSPPLLPPLLALLMVIGCAPDQGDGRDRLGAFNQRGGAGRTGAPPGVQTAPIGDLSRTSFASLKGGFRSAPLELRDFRLAAIVGGAPGASPEVVLLREDSLLWRFSYPHGEYPVPGLAADSGGRIYTISTRGRLRALDSAGRELWSHPLPRDSSLLNLPVPPLALGEGVVVADAAGNITRFDPRGRELWRRRLGGSVTTGLAASAESGLIVGVSRNEFGASDTLLSLDPATGVERWRTPLPSLRIVAQPIVTARGIALGVAGAGDESGRAPYALGVAPTGGIDFRTPLPLMPRGIAADAEGGLYIGCSGVATAMGGGALVSLDPQGKRRWQVLLQSAVAAQPIVSTSWIHFVARRDGATGIYTYGQDGTFAGFLSLDRLPDVLGEMTLTSYGLLVLAGIDAPILLRAG